MGHIIKRNVMPPKLVFDVVSGQLMYPVLGEITMFFGLNNYLFHEMGVCNGL